MLDRHDPPRTGHHHPPFGQGLQTAQPWHPAFLLGGLLVRAVVQRGDCQDWPCLYPIGFGEPGQVELFRRFGGLVLAGDLVGQAATGFVDR